MINTVKSSNSIHMRSTSLKSSPASNTLGSNGRHGGSSHVTSSRSTPSRRPLILLALRTLGSFNFNGLSLLPFVQNVVTIYLNDRAVDIRTEAAKTVSKLIRPKTPYTIGNESMPSSLHHPSLSRLQGPSAVLTASILQQMLRVSISDEEPIVRQTVIASLQPEFESYLCKPVHLKLLLIALNDEIFSIRQEAMIVIGRLASRNPAFVMLALRKTLAQLLTELNYTSDSRLKEESTILLGHVIKASQRLIKPYLLPVIHALLPKLSEGNAGLAKAVLMAFGELALVAGPEMIVYEPKLLPIIIETLHDHSSVSKREVALRTLGQLVGSTGSVVEPYLQFPSLLEILLDLLHHGTGFPWSLRREVLKTLGILGALDPYRYKGLSTQERSLASSQSGAESPFADDAKSKLNKKSLPLPTTQQPFEGSTPDASSSTIPILDAMTPSHVDYYPTVVITALMRILRDPSLSIHHNGVIQAVMFIFKSLGMRCVPFLSQILPPFFHIMRHCEYGLRESLFQQLAHLVGIVKQHIQPFLSEIFDLIQEYWETNQDQILSLVEEIALAPLIEELRHFLPLLLPLFLQSLVAGEINSASISTKTPSTSVASTSSSASQSLLLKQNATKVKILHTLVVLGSSLQDYLYLVIPALVQVLEFSKEEDVEHLGLAVKGGALECVGRLAQYHSNFFSDYLARILHPLARVLETCQHSQLQHIVLDVLCALVCELKEQYWIFEPRISQILLGNSYPRRQSLAKLQPMEQYWNCVKELQLTSTISLATRQLCQFAKGPFSCRPPLVSFLGPFPTSMTSSASTSLGDSSVVGNTSDFGGTSHINNQASSSIKASLYVNQQSLRRSWEASQRSTKEDWMEWMRRFSVELLRESPSPALRSCSALAQVYHPLARELFNAAFVSCWSELYEQYQEYLVRALETAFQSETIPPEILQTLLNLAEFMEHDVEALPIDIRQLGELAETCHAYAKALHYKELEFHTSPSTCIEALISINNQLGQPEAANGILKYAQSHFPPEVVQVKESWFEKLQNWNEALKLYTEKQKAEPDNIQVTLGRMRCLEAMGDWEKLVTLSEEVWSEKLASNSSVKAQDRLIPPLEKTSRNSTSKSAGTHFPPPTTMPTIHTSASSSTTATQQQQPSETAHRYEAAFLAARANWNLGNWSAMENYVAAADPNRTQVKLYQAILSVHHDQFEHAEGFIDQTRQQLDNQLQALVGESYSRAYTSMVIVQQLSELEEIIHYKRLRQNVRQAEEASRYRRHLMWMWKERLSGCKRVVEVWQHLLAVRSLIVSPHEDIDTWLQFASLCRAQGNLGLSLRVLQGSLGVANMVGGGNSFSIHPHAHPSNSSSFTSAARPPTIGHYSVGKPMTSVGSKDHHAVMFAYFKHLWATGEQSLALRHLQTLVSQLDSVTETKLKVKGHLKVGEWHLALHENTHSHETSPGYKSVFAGSLSDHRHDLQQETAHNTVDVHQVLNAFRLATELDPTSYKAWHAWALMNFQVVESKQEMMLDNSSNIDATSIKNQTHPRTTREEEMHIVHAIQGFFRSIALGTSRWTAKVQQDILRLLTLWFAYGHLTSVHRALEIGIEQSVPIETWLGVIPQLIARIHTPEPQIQHQLHQLMIAIASEHPQALIYPLSVALKSPLAIRQFAAESIMATMRRHFHLLVDQALLVSRELIRVAILWHEMWHEGLEEASRLYFGEQNIDGMFAVLEPLHVMMEHGPETLREVSFQQSFGRDLAEAWEWMKKYRHAAEHYHRSSCNSVGALMNRHRDSPSSSGLHHGNHEPSPPGVSRPHEGDLNHAWDLYYHVFRRINKQLPQLTNLELQHVSPALLEAQHLELAVPGTYFIADSHTTSNLVHSNVNDMYTIKKMSARTLSNTKSGVKKCVVRIASFRSMVQVITSKQRPRKITIVGEDGLDYVFLLKGHEDLRQDERVMQLFGLVNALLNNDDQTSKRDYTIQRYAVIPLSHNAGVVGWVPNCDTLHQLIRDYREARKILLNIEHRLMLQMAPDYDSLSLIQKIEVFEYALENTAGQDLYKVLWLKSRNSEIWLNRRTNYTRSLAVMSMVGYILGLGDRHPSNLMLDRFTGNIVHIDFGDCFEVAMHREKYPEKIPFRLTRMLTNAMEVSGIEGNFRSSCESVMQVLRDNRDSLMAMLGAFIHDPLICWRLLATNEGTTGTSATGENSSASSSLKNGTRTSLKSGGLESFSTLPTTVPDTPPLPEEEFTAVITTSSSSSIEVSTILANDDARDGGSDIFIIRNLLFDIVNQIELQDSTHDLRSKSISISTNTSPRAFSNGDETNQEDGSRHRNLHVEMSNLAVSVTPTGQEYLTASLLDTRRRATFAQSNHTAVPASIDGYENPVEPLLNRTPSMPMTSTEKSLQSSSPANDLPSKDLSHSVAASVSASGVRANRSHREKELVHALGPEGAGAPREALNQKALAVIRRVQSKLTGRDFEEEEALNVPAQVQRLISQANSHENLCQCYIGWCPFW